MKQLFHEIRAEILKNLDFLKMIYCRKKRSGANKHQTMDSRHFLKVFICVSRCKF